jgi:hypothetical protein
MGSSPPAVPPGFPLIFKQDSVWNWEVKAAAALSLFTGGKRLARLRDFSTLILPASP